MNTNFHNFNQLLVCLFCYIIGYRSIKCPSRRLDEYYGCSVYYQYNTMQIGAMHFENVQDMESCDGMGWNKLLGTGVHCPGSASVTNKYYPALLTPTAEISLMSNCFYAFVVGVCYLLSVLVVVRPYYCFFSFFPPCSSSSLSTINFPI